MSNKGKKRGQISIFIIIAIVIVIGIVLFLVLRDRLGIGQIPSELKPVFDYYEGCLRDEARVAVDILGNQGGRIYIEEYEEGSDYAPFSSELNFLGFSVPYWFYISGNGLIREKVPTKRVMEKDIERYVEENIWNCDFSDYTQQGFLISLGEPKATVTIQNKKIIVKINQKLSVVKDESAAVRELHNAEISSSLGKLYNTARKIYAAQKENAFFEQYTADVLNLYAPVDGVEISCSGKIWKTKDVVEELKSGIEANIATIRFGDKSIYGRDYFVIDLPVEEDVRLLYSRAWPSRIEIYGEDVDESVIIAQPIGNQEGLGVLGFCYVPYHFVYDILYPVMVQIYDSSEVFQFPLVVAIDKNLPRVGIFSQIYEDEDTMDICKFRNKDIEVKVFDINLNPVDANLSYSCFDQRCSLGQTEGGVYRGTAPSCYNGYLEARAENYASKKQLFSSNEEQSIEVILDREFEVIPKVFVDGTEIEGSAIISFKNKEDGRTITTALPQAERIRISEGDYIVSVYVYDNSSITLPASTKRVCNEVPKSGILGFFGGTEERCEEITLPEMNVDYALVAGGVSSIYLLQNELEKGKMNIFVTGMERPVSFEQLQYNFEAVSSMGVEIEFEGQ